MSSLSDIDDFYTSKYEATYVFQGIDNEGNDLVQEEWDATYNPQYPEETGDAVPWGDADIIDQGTAPSSVFVYEEFSRVSSFDQLSYLQAAANDLGSEYPTQETETFSYVHRFYTERNDDGTIDTTSPTIDVLYYRDNTRDWMDKRQFQVLTGLSKLDFVLLDRGVQRAIMETEHYEDMALSFNIFPTAKDIADIGSVQAAINQRASELYFTIENVINEIETYGVEKFIEIDGEVNAYFIPENLHLLSDIKQYLEEREAFVNHIRLIQRNNAGERQSIAIANEDTAGLADFTTVVDGTDTYSFAAPAFQSFIDAAQVMEEIDLIKERFDTYAVFRDMPFVVSPDDLEEINYTYDSTTGTYTLELPTLFPVVGYGGAVDFLDIFFPPYDANGNLVRNTFTASRGNSNNAIGKTYNLDNSTQAVAGPFGTVEENEADYDDYIVPLFSDLATAQDTTFRHLFTGTAGTGDGLSDVAKGIIPLIQGAGTLPTLSDAEKDQIIKLILIIEQGPLENVTDLSYGKNYSAFADEVATQQQIIYSNEKQSLDLVNSVRVSGAYIDPARLFQTIMLFEQEKQSATLLYEGAFLEQINNYIDLISQMQALVNKMAAAFGDDDKDRAFGNREREIPRVPGTEDFPDDASRVELSDDELRLLSMLLEGSPLSPLETLFSQTQGGLDSELVTRQRYDNIMEVEAQVGDFAPPVEDGDFVMWRWIGNDLERKDVELISTDIASYLSSIEKQATSQQQTISDQKQAENRFREYVSQTQNRIIESDTRIASNFS